MRVFTRGVLAVLACGALALPVQAAEISLYTGAVFKSALDDLLPRFEVRSGHHVTIVYDSTAGIEKRINGGAAFDVVIASQKAVQGWAQSGIVTSDAAEKVGVARAALGFPANAQVPDISTDEKFRAVVLGAAVISSSDPAAGGASAVFFQTEIKRLGIADAVQSHLLLTKPGVAPGPVADGKATLAVAMTSEIAGYPGLQSAVFFPDHPGGALVLTAAISAKAAQKEAAAALISFLAAPEAAAVGRSKGLAE